MLQTQTAEQTRAGISPRASRKQSSLVEVTDQFAVKSRPAQEDIKRYKEMFYALVFRANAMDRKKISIALSRSHYTPRAIGLFFALDEIAIAAPMLLFSPVFSAKDLNSVLEKSSAEHGRVIARRLDLEESTVRMLLRFDNEQCRYRPILEKNANLASNPRLAALLKLPACELAEDTKNTEPEVTEIHVTLPVKSSSPVKDMSVDLLALAKKGGKLGRRKISVPPLEMDSTEQFQRQLLKNARDTNRAAFAFSIQRMCGLEYKKTLLILENQDAGKLASLLCALGIGKRAASQILLLLNRNVGRDVKVFKAIMARFETLDKTECENFFQGMGAEFKNPALKRREQNVENYFKSAANERRMSYGMRGLPGKQQLPSVMARKAG